LADFLVGEGK
jgi:hypothetical protein